MTSRTPAGLSALRWAVLGAAVAVIAPTLAACGDDASTNPATLFAGTYSVTRTTTTVDGAPATGTDATPATSTWVVQTSCAGPGDGCVAVASSTSPDPGLTYDQDRMEFVFENGTWDRVVVPPTRPCVPDGESAPVDEPWVALDSATMRINESASRVIGTLRSVQGGSCSSSSEGTITLSRTGGLPSATPRIGEVRVPPKVESPAAGFRGSYEQKTTIVAWNPPSLIRTPTTETSRFTATPTCTRDGVTCAVVMYDAGTPGQSPTVAGYTGGPTRTLSQVETVGPRRCADGRQYRPVLTSTTTLPTDAGSPVQSVTSTSTLSWTEACPGRVTFENDVRRVGD
ncbi:hypothetical protein [Williamsia deligens]|uniref:Ig-like domain-containing protein n=1 Tax=Williamsia deligens TaxID=321325 RepID=A0ABW3GAF4_9NOCA|nr:hypothetical protein [Williamsia deligens]MCP2193494.1 hypothetical protein [Williamsia deligens]